jgi:hypothetical protein
MHCILRDVVRDDLSLSERRQFRRPRKQCGLGGWPEPHLFFLLHLLIFLSFFPDVILSAAGSSRSEEACGVEGPLSHLCCASVYICSPSKRSRGASTPKDEALRDRPSPLSMTKVEGGLKKSAGKPGVKFALPHLSHSNPNL